MLGNPACVYNYAVSDSLQPNIVFVFISAVSFRALETDWPFRAVQRDRFCILTMPARGEFPLAGRGNSPLQTPACDGAGRVHGGRVL